MTNWTTCLAIVLAMIANVTACRSQETPRAKARNLLRDATKLTRATNMPMQLAWLKKRPSCCRTMPKFSRLRAR